MSVRSQVGVACLTAVVAAGGFGSTASAVAQGAKLSDPAAAADLALRTAAAAEAAARGAPLRVGKACFVEKVKQFGVYEPLPPDYALSPGFLPGGTAVLYAEIENAVAAPEKLALGGDGFVTRLDCELELLDAGGGRVAKFDPASAPDLAVKEHTRSRLRDLFLKFEFQVPKAAGRYTLAVTVREPGTGRAAKAVVHFAVAGK